MPVVVDDRVAVAGAGARRNVAIPRRLAAVDDDAYVSARAGAQHYDTLRIAGPAPLEHNTRAVDEGPDAEDVRRPREPRVPSSLGRRRARSAPEGEHATTLGGRSAACLGFPWAAASSSRRPQPRAGLPGDRVSLFPRKVPEAAPATKITAASATIGSHRLRRSIGARAQPPGGSASRR